MASNFLEKLPAEMRNNIYELVITADRPDEEVEIKQARPLSKNILLTCKQVHAEARGMYR